MIIQCDHCSAKFKMDDSKLANGPVKVRCAKCKEVFVVRKEEPAEEKAAVITPAASPAQPAAFSVPATELAASGIDADDTGFSFDQEPPAVKESLPVEQPEASNEFDWQSSSVSFDSAQGGAEFDLSSFESSIAAPKDADIDQGGIPDSDDFNFDDAQAPDVKSAELAPQGDFSMDFGEVSFAEPKSAPVESAASSSDFAADLFKFPPELPRQHPESSSADDFVLSFNADIPEKGSQLSSRPESVEEEGVNFGDFSFGDMEASPAKVKSDEPAYTKAVAEGFLPEEQFEDLPPSSLSSRKKSGSQFPLLVIIGAIVLIVSLAGFGVYSFGGSKAFSNVGLGFLVDWYGDKGGEEGSISLRNITAGYTTNSTAGELFVVRGEAVNNYKKPRASIQVKVSVTGTAGSVLVSKSAYTGNSLSAEQLNTLPMAKIDEVMNNQFGDSLANLGLKPGSAIPFVVVIASVPKDATDYTVQVSGSTVATQ